MVKQKRKEKAGKWNVPIPKVRAQSEADVFKVIQTGKRKKKAWKRKVCFQIMFEYIDQLDFVCVLC